MKNKIIDEIFKELIAMPKDELLKELEGRESGDIASFLLEMDVFGDIENDPTVQYYQKIKKIEETRNNAETAIALPGIRTRGRHSGPVQIRVSKNPVKIFCSAKENGYVIFPHPESVSGIGEEDYTSVYKSISHANEFFCFGWLYGSLSEPELVRPKKLDYSSISSWSLPEGKYRHALMFLSRENETIEKIGRIPFDKVANLSLSLYDNVVMISITFE